MVRTWMVSVVLLAACAGSDTDPTDVLQDTDTTPGSSDTDVPPTDTDVTDTDDTDVADTDVTDTGGDTGTTPCAYPVGAVEPMAVDEVLSPYSWPEAIHRDGRSLDLDLAQVPCADDPDIDWSPHDVLVFVSIPAW